MATHFDSFTSYGESRRPIGVCPHGDDPRECDRGACDEGWDY